MDCCILVKKSGWFGLKLDFAAENMLQVVAVVPSLYFRGFVVGRGLTAPIVRAIISGKQNAMLDEITKSLAPILD